MNTMLGIDAYTKLGETDKARQLFQALVESGQRAVQGPPEQASGGRRGFGRPVSERARTADAHYTAGLATSA